MHSTLDKRSYAHGVRAERNPDRERTAEGAKTTWQSQAKPSFPIKSRRFRTLKLATNSGRRREALGF
jgi:hypothetical protein